MRFYTPKFLKWVLRFYPPFFFQRIWIRKVYKDFTGAEVKIYKSLLNINGNSSIFGGTIFSAIDPMYPLLFDAFFKKNNIRRTVVWLKSADITYKKPGRKSLTLSVRISEEDRDEALQAIKENGKYIKTFYTEIYDTGGTLCAVANNEIYIRDLDFDFEKKELKTQLTETI